MPPCTDIYTLSKERSSSFPVEFLDKFLPQRRSLFNEHIVEGGNITLQTIDDLFIFLENNKNISHTLYMSPLKKNTEPNRAMISFTTDGYIIIGLSCEEIHHELAKTYLEELKSFAKTNHGFYGFEYAPPVNSVDYFEAVDKFNKGILLSFG